MKKYLRLMRVHHYIKNFLIFLPIFFSRRLCEVASLEQVIIGFFAFGFLSSIIYIINDIQDIESDRQHPVKCKRPLASGEIEIKKAVILIVSLAIIIILLGLSLNWKLSTWAMLFFYFLINIVYSCMGGKNIPVIDVSILAAGFLLRVTFGASIIDVNISNWLYLTVTSMAFWMGLGKRRNEMRNMGNNANNTRKVLKYYTYSFLDKNMYMCMSLMLVFYSLWSVDVITLDNLSTKQLVWTVPLVIIIAMRYSMNIEKKGEECRIDGDPVEVLLGDKVLLGLGGLLVLIIFFLIYF